MRGTCEVWSDARVVRVPLVDCHVWGRPVPQGSKRIVRGRMIDVNARALKAWRTTVAAACRVQMSGGAVDAPVEVTLRFYLTRPSRPRWVWPAVRPDVDKLTRAVLDAMTHVVYRDDGLVVAQHAYKAYVTPDVHWDEPDGGAGVHIRVEELSLDPRQRKGS